MSNLNEENPRFITIVAIFGSYHVDLMEWDTRADSYMVAMSKQFHDQAAARAHAESWAAQEGVEVR